MGTLRRACATVPQPSELRFGVVRAVGSGIAVSDGGPHSARRRAGFGVFVPHFHNGECDCVADGEMLPIRTCENLTTFPFGKRIVGKLDSWTRADFGNRISIK